MSADIQMPAVLLADGRIVTAPCGADGRPDWSAVEAVHGSPIAAAEVEAARVLSVLEFRRRFEPSEKAALYTASTSQPLLRAWLDDLSAATEVHLDHPDVVMALGWLVQAGILTEARAAETRA